MPQFAVVVPHRLGQNEAAARVQQFLDRVQREHADKLSDMQGNWHGNQLQFSFLAMGMGIQGTMNVEEDQVNVKGQLPLAASFFRGRIEQTIQSELQNVLS